MLAKPRRRPQGDGTMYRKADGRWCCEITINGKRYQDYGKTERDVAAKLTAIKVEHATGKLVKPSRRTVGDLLWLWFDATRQSKAEKTYVSDKSTIHRHIASKVGARRAGASTRLGKTPITKVEPAHIQVLLADLETKGKGVRTRQLVLGVLHQAFAWAVLPNRWLRYNPCDGTPKPKNLAPRAIRSLTEEERAKLLDAARGDRLEALYVLALTVGGRFGELLGLFWDDIDLKNGKVTISHTLLDIGRRLERKPKLKRGGPRTIKLASIAVAALREHREKAFAEGQRANPWVFHDEAGQPLHQRDVTVDSFQPLLDRAGLPRMHFHDLRHSFASLMLKAGVPLMVVSAILGHARPSTTLNYYGHVLPGMHDAAIEQLDASLNRQYTVKTF